jgi:hypothetical protein
MTGASGRLSAPLDRLPIRTRVAVVSALLTFVILCAFAVAIGSLTVRRIRDDFNRQVADTANTLSTELKISVAPTRGEVRIFPPLTYFASPADHAVVRIFAGGGGVIAQQPKKAPSFGQPLPAAQTIKEYRVVSRSAVVRLNGEIFGEAFIQYARSTSDTEATVARVELFLLLGVLAGTALALLAGMAIARRAMAPIAELTKTAAEIARTRDPSRRRAGRPRRCSPASGSSSPTPLTSCGLP